jgi:histidine kinase 2/3/4 (cytokinin receptor)
VKSSVGFCFLAIYLLVELSLWVSLRGLILMTCSAGTGGFLKLSRLLVEIHRWVLVKMSLDCKVSGFNGRLPACSKLKKTKEQLHGPNSVRKWRRRLLFLWLIVVTLGSVWFFSSWNAGTFTGKDMTPDSCDGKAQILLPHFNVSKSQLHVLASLFFESDQVLC